MKKIVINVLKSRLFNFVFVFLTWIVTVTIFYNAEILKNVNPDILLLIHLGAFFFALTTSPTTWIIKGLGIEIGSNTPNHFQIDRTTKKDETTVIVRDYSHTHGAKEINEILSEQSKK